MRDADTGPQLDDIGAAPHPPTTPPVSEQWPEAWRTALAGAGGKADVSGVAAWNDLDVRYQRTT